MGRRERGSNESGQGLGKREDPGDKVEELSLFSVQLQLAADFFRSHFQRVGKMAILYMFFILLHGCETRGKSVWFSMISDKHEVTSVY